jgi:hypothetical protein
MYFDMYLFKFFLFIFVTKKVLFSLVEHKKCQRVLEGKKIDVITGHP